MSSVPLRTTSIFFVALRTTHSCKRKHRIKDEIPELQRKLIPRAVCVNCITVFVICTVGVKTQSKPTIWRGASRLDKMFTWHHYGATSGCIRCYHSSCRRCSVDNTQAVWHFLPCIRCSVNSTQIVLDVQFCFWLWGNRPCISPPNSIPLRARLELIPPERPKILLLLLLVPLIPSALRSVRGKRAGWFFGGNKKLASSSRSFRHHPKLGIRAKIRTLRHKLYE